jgi:hypothetical protein
MATRLRMKVSPGESDTVTCSRCRLGEGIGYGVHLADQLLLLAL